MVYKEVKDIRVISLIRKYVQARVMERGIFNNTQKGVPQGGNLSPLLSNIMLNELDKELEKRGLCFCRYADDCNIYVKTRKGYWRISNSPILATTLSNKYLKEQGFITLTERYL